MDLLRSALPREPDPALAEAVARPRLAAAAVAALAAARARPSHATPILSRWFREQRALGSKERPVVAEAVYGVIRHERLLARAGADDDPARVRCWARLVAGERFPELESRGEVDDLATALSLPDAVAAEWLARLGAAEAGALAAALAGRAPLDLRANRALIDRETLAARLLAAGVVAEPCPATPDGLRVRGRANAQSLPGFREGLFEVQDEASQRLIAALEPLLRAQGEAPRALDLCAGAGGKTLALAALGARVRAFDRRSHALDELVSRARRAGLLDRIAPGEPRPAPLVLVDAPCSGTGRLRRDPALRWGLEPARHLAAQAALLAEGARLTLPGGALVYATCSLLAAENAHQPGPGFTLLERRELWPQRDGTDGFFWSIWRKA